jgi:hypothetical protein
MDEANQGLAKPKNPTQTLIGLTDTSLSLRMICKISLPLPTGGEGKGEGEMGNPSKPSESDKVGTSSGDSP